MNLKESQKVHKNAVLERSKNMTDSPLSNLSSKEKIEFVRSEFGEEAAKKVVESEIKNIRAEEPDYVTPDMLKERINHLPNYEHSNNVIGLQGQEYTIIKKEIYKFIIARVIPEHLKIIKLGQIQTDMRVHANCVLSSGKGKKNIASAVKKILKRFDPEINIKEPRTIHYQHLIGKMLLRKEEETYEDSSGKTKTKKKDVWIPKYGFLNSDVLILEEAFEVFNSQEKNDVDCRDALTVSMDMFGENLIMKQSMDNLDNDEETLQYFPYNSNLSFLQPLKMNESFVVKGLSRRMHTLYRNFPDKTSLDKYASRLHSKVDDEKSIESFCNFLFKISKVTGNWKMNPKAIDIFLLCHGVLLEQGFRSGGKIASYTKMLEYPMQNTLLKMSALQSIVNLRTEITAKDVINAFLDIIERFVYESQYIENKVKGTLDYGESWNGATGKNQECLEELFNLGASSKETSIPIWQFQKVISEIFNISDRRSKDRYKNMKEEGMISDYRGQGKDNGVWLNFKPDTKSTKKDDLLNPKKLYLKFSDMTEMSDMTPKTDIPLIIKTELSSLYNNTDDKTTKKHTPKRNVISEKKDVKKNNNKNTSLGVISDISDISDKKKANPFVKSENQNVISENQNVISETSTRDLHYSKDPITKDIQPCDKNQVKKYIKKNPKYTKQDLLKEFGSGVLNLKKEGVVKW